MKESEIDDQGLTPRDPVEEAGLADAACPECAGAGTLPDGPVCPVCLGAGRANARTGGG